MHPDEDPKLTQGSKPPIGRYNTPVIQDLVITPVGTVRNDIDEGGALLNVVNDNIGALYLTADAPQSYKEAMR